MRRALGIVLAGRAPSRLRCGKKAEKTPPPAKVEGAKPETELATVTLTPEAEQRLGLTFAPVERRAVPHVRTVGGIVEAPPGRSLPITAPLAGTVLAPESGVVPTAGARVTRGQALFRLAPAASRRPRDPARTGRARRRSRRPPACRRRARRRSARASSARSARAA